MNFITPTKPAAVSHFQGFKEVLIKAALPLQLFYRGRVPIVCLCSSLRKVEMKAKATRSWIDQLMGLVYDISRDVVG